MKIDKPNKLEILSYSSDFIKFRKKKPNEVINTINKIAKANNNKKFIQYFLLQLTNYQIFITNFPGVFLF